MNYTQALSTHCTGAGQHENEFSLVLHEVQDVEIGAGVYVSCPACNESAQLGGVESLASYFAPYATDDIYRLHTYGVISWEQAIAIMEAREAAELEEGLASCRNCAGVFPAAKETICAWCGAEVVPSAPAVSYAGGGRWTVEGKGYLVQDVSAAWSAYNLAGARCPIKGSTSVYGGPERPGAIATLTDWSTAE